MALNKHMNKLFMMKEGIVYRLWCEDNKTEECIVVPEVLQNPLLMLAHNYSGHNGFRRTYNALKRQYYWPGMRKHILKHCKACHQCSLQNQGPGELEFGHFNVPSVPMEFICMDLVGPISPQTSKGNKYMLTVIDMLTGYTIAVAIPDKRAETVCKAYRDNVYCIFGGSSRILTDNGTEFRSKEMKQICDELEIKQVFSPVYTPQANGRLEGWHRFLKSCIAKHIRGTDVEWDDLIPLAVSAYNFFPCQSSKESPFVLMFGRDPITPIAKLLEPKLKFYGEKGVSLRMDTLCKLYTVAAENIRRAREKHPRQETVEHKFQVNDMVLVKDPESAVFEPRYMPNYRIVAIHGKNRIEVQDEKGNRSIRRSGHVKPCQPTEKVCHQLPPQEVYEQYGRTSKLLLHPKDVPHVPLEVFKEQRQVKKSEDHEVETSSIDDMKEIMVDNHDESRSRVGSETPMEDLTMDQYTVEVCVLELHPERDMVHSLLTDQKGEIIEKEYGQCPTTFDNSIEIDISDKLKSRFQGAVTGALKKGAGEKQTDNNEECSSINTSDESRSRCEYYTYSAELNDEDDVDINDESRTRLHRPVLSIMKEGAKQTIKPRTGYERRYFDNTDASKSRKEIHRKNSVNSKELQDCKESMQRVRLQTPMELTLVSDSCDESRCRGNRCFRSAGQDVQQPAPSVAQNRCIEPPTVNMHDNDKSLATNKCVLTKQRSTLMGNQWLSNAFSRFASSILGKSNEGKVDNININSNANSKSKSKPDFNFFL